MRQNPTKENCHDACKLTVLHSECFLAPTLKTPIMAQMLHKLETLPNRPQNQKRFAQYASVERILGGN